MFPVIAIDGTAASGKSTVAREVAQRLGFVYVNTGEMYRGVTWWFLKQNVLVENAHQIVEALREVSIDCEIENGKTFFRINGIDPVEHARELRVNEKVSLVASVPEVRKLLVEKQQALAEKAPLVMEGRDIGTVVFKETPHKFYIDADPAIRAQRRQRQGEQDLVINRDQTDISRKTSPLTRAPSAVMIDSGKTTIEETVKFILEQVKIQGLATPSH